MYGDVLVTGPLINAVPSSLDDQYQLLLHDGDAKRHGLRLEFVHDPSELRLVVSNLNRADVWELFQIGLLLAEDYEEPPVVRVRPDQ